MDYIVSALLIDDDPNALEFLKWKLEEMFPQIRVATSTYAQAYAGFDIYFIDNNFDGRNCALSLAKKLRQLSPEALIVVLSGHLNPTLLKNLLNTGCNGACEKDNPKDILELMHITRHYLKMRIQTEEEKPTVGFGGAVHAISSMLSQWNNRLTHQEQQAGE